MLALLFVLPLRDARSAGAESAYRYTYKLFLHGELARCQQETERAYRQFQIASPSWASQFQLLEAESMLYRGMADDAVGLLASFQPDSHPSEAGVLKLAIEGVAFSHQRQLLTADQRLTEAEGLCRIADFSTCGDVMQARGIYAGAQGKPLDARRSFLAALAFAEKHRNRFLEANSNLNLGWAALQVDRYDEAVDWSRSSAQRGAGLGAENLVQTASGNLGWAYYQLGDSERALDLFLDAEKNAEKQGDLRMQLTWVAASGMVYKDSGDLARAIQSFRQELYLAHQINGKQDIMDALENLVPISVETGNLNDADAAIREVEPMERANGHKSSPYLLLGLAKLAIARGQIEPAQKWLHVIETDPASLTTQRLGAGLELAKIDERQGNDPAAEMQYKATLATFESARSEVKNEELKLPFTANATRIYDGYIQLLARHGRSDEALSVANRSRARTLAQGLGVAFGIPITEALHPNSIARQTGSTLLFYWLSDKQSYLWAITPNKTTIYPLPAQAEIVSRVQRYQKALLNLQDPLEEGNEDGRALYKILVAPAAASISPNAQVTILADGTLNQLNFETLIAPGAASAAGLTHAAGAKQQVGEHYWIEDVTLVSAPSLSMLSGTTLRTRPNGKLLLIGDAVSPNPDYPELPMAEMEMGLIEKHFPPHSETIFAREKAMPETYAASQPAQYSYIHFVTHGTASRMDPLDSAVILSRSQADPSTFKLYAREIVQHPIDARLVTISACYGSGTRSYSGEGLIGLSWAFLRAGAHNVIGALWEVSDDSTPRLMNSLYQGLNQGQKPGTALRRAKLGLLHGAGHFRAPFFWAPFQIYSGL